MEKTNINLEQKVRDEHKRLQEIEQEKLILSEVNDEQKNFLQNSQQQKYIIIAITAIVLGSGFATYSIYVSQLVGEQYKVPSNGTPSNYVIQNLQGDIVNTWVAWNIADNRVIHVHITNAANLPQNMIDVATDAILSTKTVPIDDSLTGKGPKGTSSTYYVGWEGATQDAYTQPTKIYIPQKFEINGSPDGVGDIEVIFTNDINPDGYSGYTKSLVDGNEILKSKITIYKADKLDTGRLEAIMRHEFGHALGLGHSTASEDLMYTMLPDYPYISECDVDAIKELYDGKKSSQVICQK